MTGAALEVARLRANVAALEADTPGHASALREAAAALEVAQRNARPGQGLAAVTEARNRYEATKGLHEHHAAALAAALEALRQADAALTREERDTQARANVERAGRLAAALDTGREALEREAARLITLQHEHARLEADLMAQRRRADAGPYLAALQVADLPRPAPLSAFGAHVANYGGLAPVQLDPETLEAVG